MSNTTIAQKLQLALNNKSDIKSSLIAKGINVGDKMSEWSDAIDNAQIGGVEPIRATFAGSNSEIKIMDSANWYNYGISKLLANDKEVNTTTLPANLGGYYVEYYTLKLPETAFRFCSNLTSVTIPNSITSIGRNAFLSCYGLTKAEFASIESLCQILFLNTTSNPLYYANHLYINGQEVTDVVIPNSITSIKAYTFYGCSSLTSVTIPNSVTIIGGSAFAGCYGLTSVTIPNSVTSIGNGAFSNCSSLTSVTIPNSVTIIGGSAFAGCYGLTSVTIPNSVTIIGGSAFAGCSGLISIVVESGNKKYDSRNNCNAIIETSTNKLIVGCKNTVIPNSVTIIDSRAFDGCTGLTSITIPNSVTRIGAYAFYYCGSLTSVTIPNSVTSIEEYAFYACRGLTKAEFASIESLCQILFLNTTSNPLWYAHHLYINGQEVTDVVIPNGITSIKAYTFYGCSSLTSVTIPNSVTSIGQYAFGSCDSLFAIYSDGLRAELDVSSSKQHFDVESIQSVIDTWQEGGAIRFSLESALYLKGILIVGEKAHWEGNTLMYGKGGGGYYY